MSSCSEAQSELATHHHGLVDAPVLAADGAPALRAPDVHQHLHASLRRLSPSCQTHLVVQKRGGGGSHMSVDTGGGLVHAAPPHRGLQARVGHVAADRHVLVVLAGVKRHLSVATLGDGPLPARALHAVHVDGAGTWGSAGSGGGSLILMF